MNREKLKSDEVASELIALSLCNTELPVRGWLVTTHCSIKRELKIIRTISTKVDTKSYYYYYHGWEADVIMKCSSQKVIILAG